MSKLLVAGSSGLIGSEVVDHFCRFGGEVHGVDNNMRADFFGSQGDHICYISNLEKMKAHYPGWGLTKNLTTIFEEIHESWLQRTGRKQFQVTDGS